MVHRHRLLISSSESGGGASVQSDDRGKRRSVARDSREEETLAVLAVFVRVDTEAIVRVCGPRALFVRNRTHHFPMIRFDDSPPLARSVRCSSARTEDVPAYCPGRWCGG